MLSVVCCCCYVLMSFANYEYELALDLSALQDFSFLDGNEWVYKEEEKNSDSLSYIPTQCVIEGEELRLLRDEERLRRGASASAPKK